MTTLSEKLPGRTALVTGAGRGIGRAVALDLARAGAAVAVVARTQAELDETAALIARDGGRSVAVSADLADAEQLHAALRRATGELGPVEILVNNAAVVWPIAASAVVDADEWAAALGINVTAVARLSFAVLPGMIEAGWGRIVNVSSGVAGWPASMLRANAYVTAKAALEAHTVNLAAELDGTGVTVNAYRPGTVDTDMQLWIRTRDVDQIGVPLRDRFVGYHEGGSLITAQASAASLMRRLPGGETGQIWAVSDPA